MTEEKESIENLKNLVQLRKDKTNTIKYDTCICSTKELDIVLNLIQTQQAELEKKDKMIDLMADKLVEAHEWFYSEFDNYTKEDFKQYFEK